MCVLHNLSYRLDAEVPTRYRQLEYSARNAYTEKSSTGCFSNKSDKMMVSGARALPVLSADWRLPPGAGRGRPRRRGLCAGTVGAQTTCRSRSPQRLP